MTLGCPGHERLLGIYKMQWTFYIFYINIYHISIKIKTISFFMFLKWRSCLLNSCTNQQMASIWPGLCLDKAFAVLLPIQTGSSSDSNRRIPKTVQALLYRVRRGYRIKFCEHDDNRTVQVLALARYYGGCPNLEFEHVPQFGKISPYLNPKSLTLIPISLQSLDSTMKFINIHNQ